MKFFQSHTLILAQHLIRYFTFCNQLFKSRHFQNLESNSIEVAQRYRFQVDPKKIWAQKHFEPENILAQKHFELKKILNSKTFWTQNKFWARKHFELKIFFARKHFVRRVFFCRFSHPAAVLGLLFFRNNNCGRSGFDFFPAIVNCRQFANPLLVRRLI